MTTENQKKHLLSEMYPYDITGKKNADLRKGLREYSCLLNALEEASYHFQAGNLERFDALVGENACQIRAIKIAIMASKGEVDFKCLDLRISGAKKKLEDLLAEKKLGQLMLDNALLDDLIENEIGDLTLTYEQLFLFQSFLLCEMKERDYSGETSSFTMKNKTAPKKLKRISPDVSTNFTLCLANKIRKEISEKSVDFVRRISTILGDENLVKMNSSDFMLNHNTLSCIPLFWSYKALLKTAQNESIPLVIHAKFSGKTNISIEDEILFFDPTEKKYFLRKIEKSDFHKSACIIQGVVCTDTQSGFFDKSEWLEKISSDSVINIILAGAADHRQYPNSDIEISPEDSEFTDYKTFAKNEGYSLENPSTFFINHVFPMQIKNLSTLAIAC